ncbi:MAG: FkbM family methyltransferase [Patescibacteria group bacterium]|nr:FkbM family methyltransferase [Patescibacteria group bacterium]
MKIKKIIKKGINCLGLDLRKYRKETDELKWLEHYDIKTVIDVGANTGQFAREIRGRLPKSKIYSFEPINECYEELINHMSGDENFQAFNLALGDKNEKSEINKCVYSPSSSLREMAVLHEEMFPHTRGGEKQEIALKRLDDVFEKDPLRKNILIKIDVQGCEDKVIKGGLKILSEAKVALIETSFFELYKDQPQFDDIYETMKRLGFHYCGRIHQKMNPSTGEILFEDAIFIKNP